MEHEASEAERLHAAVEGLLRGEAAAPVEDPEWAAMLRAAARLAEAAPGVAGGPRPGFVLGLEEALRTDLRLGPAGAAPVAGRPWWRLGLGALLAAAGLALMGLVVSRAGPDSPLRPLQGALDAARVAVEVTPGGRAALHLDLGWRNLAELRRMLAAGPVDPRALAGLVAELEGHYAEALRLAAGAGDDRLLRRAGREAADVAAALGALAAGASPPEPVLRAGEASLELLIRRAAVLVGPTLPGPGPTAAPVVVVPPASPTPGDPAPGEPSALPPSASPTALARPSPLPPSATPPPPSATAPPPSATPPPEPPTREPIRPPTRVRTATVPPSAEPPTPTRPPNATVTPLPSPDRWPTASQVPPGPTPPGETPGVP